MLHFDTVHPRDLSQFDWRHLQGIAHDGFNNEMPGRTSAEIDNLVGWNDPARYYNSHVDPNSEVGGRFNAKQSFWLPRVALAFDGMDVVGFGYAAHNVSGSKPRQLLKLAGHSKKYLWLREVAVHPTAQHRGIGKTLLANLAKSGSPFQPLSAYIWPEEVNFLPAKLEALGFAPAGEQNVQIFGEDSQPVRQVRMVAANAGEVAVKLAR